MLLNFCKWPIVPTPNPWPNVRIWTPPQLQALRFDGDVAYSYKNFESFLNLPYQYDFELTELSVTTGPQPENDRDDVLMRVGVRYFDNNGSNGSLEYSKRFGRDDFDEDKDTISFTVRADF
jgi:hypothetical protein